jgi:hypothetical protein
MSQFREIAASTSDTEMLKNLSSSKEVGIRYEVASNKNTPKDILEKLARDSYESVATAARNNLDGIEIPSSEKKYELSEELHPQGAKGSYQYLEKLENRSGTFLLLTILSLAIGVILLFISIGSASSSYGGFFDGPAAVSLLISIALFQMAFIFAVGYIFTSTMAQHAAVNYHLAQEK